MLNNLQYSRNARISERKVGVEFAMDPLAIEKLFTSIMCCWNALTEPALHRITTDLAALNHLLISEIFTSFFRFSSAQRLHGVKRKNQELWTVHQQD